MQDNSNLSVLVIDPNPGMRGNLQNMLNQSGINKIEFAVSSGTAIKQLAQEILRHHPVRIRPWQRLRRRPGRPAAAGRPAPPPADRPADHLHHDHLGRRLQQGGQRGRTDADRLHPQAVHRRRAERAHRPRDRAARRLPARPTSRSAMATCAKRSACARLAEAAHSRYALDFARLRAELHVQPEGARPRPRRCTRAILAAKPLGWAGLGLARTLFAQERFDEAAAVLTKLVADNPKLMAAYDLLARCHEASGAHAPGPAHPRRSGGDFAAHGAAPAQAGRSRARSRRRRGGRKIVPPGRRQGQVFGVPRSGRPRQPGQGAGHAKATRRRPAA